MYAIFVNFTCINRTPVYSKHKVPRRFSLDRFHCIQQGYMYIRMSSYQLTSSMTSFVVISIVQFGQHGFPVLTNLTPGDELILVLHIHCQSPWKSFQMYVGHWENSNKNLFGLFYVILMSLSTIFQLYRGVSFIGGGKDLWNHAMNTSVQ